MGFKIYFLMGIFFHTFIIKQVLAITFDAGIWFTFSQQLLSFTNFSVGFHTFHVSIRHSGLDLSLSMQIST